MAQNYLPYLLRSLLGRTHPLVLDYWNLSMISFVFFALLTGACCAVLMETLGDEIRTIYQKAIDHYHGHKDPIEQMRALKDQIK